MKSLYVTSIDSFSGKTATCLALGKRFQADGYKVGYLKPLSLQPWRSAGKIMDEDAVFVKETLDLPESPWDLSPVVITPEFLDDILRDKSTQDLMEKVRAAYQSISPGRDILLLEGGGSLREGYVVDLPTPVVAHALSSNVLVIVKFRSNIGVLDDVLTAKQRLGDLLNGVIINRVPFEASNYLKDLAIPHLEKRGVVIFGFLPEVPGLAALTVAELIESLDAKILTKEASPKALVETLTVGAMTVEAALHRFRKQTNKAVITGGDRTDIQLAALETSTTCLILTGNLRPSPLIVKQADAVGVPLLLVPTNTMETVEKVESIFGKTHLGQPAKLAQFQGLLAEHVDMARLYELLEMKPRKP